MKSVGTVTKDYKAYNAKQDEKKVMHKMDGYTENMEQIITFLTICTSDEQNIDSLT